MKQHYVMLAQDYQSGKHRIGGQFASEKLDGIRAIWDGGITRGMFADEVPWCNSAKHDRFTFRLKATGLWSRHGQPIQAPDWWLNQMPKMLLDGELWGGRGMWQELCSAVQAKKYGSTFKIGETPVMYVAFDCPAVTEWLKDREIDEPNIKMSMKGCIDWFHARWENFKYDHCLIASEPFTHTYKVLQDKLAPFEEAQGVVPLKEAQGLGLNVCYLEQTLLPFGSTNAEAELERLAASVAAIGGEGLIIRQTSSRWIPERTYDLLKMKPEHDAEATIIGYKWGKKTMKGSKLLGKMGAAICELPNGKTFELSGFTDAEREMVSAEGNTRLQAMQLATATSQQGKEVGTDYHNPKFPRGTVITFKYREWSKDGLPKEARYFRKHESVKKTIGDWGAAKGITVLDPDGFDRKDPELWTRLFTEAEFDEAVERSTTMRTAHAEESSASVVDGKQAVAG